jgi:hypothetical protein
MIAAKNRSHSIPHLGLSTQKELSSIKLAVTAVIRQAGLLNPDYRNLEL